MTRLPVAALLLSLALLLAAAADLTGTLRTLDRSLSEAARSQRVIDAADALLSTVKDAETGQRGYLLTGSGRYLQPYEAALTRLDADLATLRMQVTGQPREDVRLSAVAALVAAKRGELARTVALATGGRRADALATVATGRGLVYMDRLRTALAQVAGAERARLADRQAALADARARAVNRAILASLAAVLTTAAAFWSLSRRGRLVAGRLATTEAELSSRIAQLGAIYDAAPVGLSFSDRDLRYVAINDRMAAINGAPVEAHIGRTTAEAVPEIAASVEPLYRRVLDTGEPVLDIEVHTPTAATGGAARDFVASYWPVRDDAGAVMGVNVVVLDITERKAAETALAASEARLRAVYDAVPVGIVTAELPSGRITGGNAFVEQVTGHPIILSDGVDSYDDWVSFHADGRQVDSHEYPIARMALAGEETPEIEVLYDRAGGRSWTRIMGRPIRDTLGAITGAVVVLVDVDELRRGRERLEREVAERTADLAAANAQLEAFAYTVSHDLRAPLRGMEGFARILLDDFGTALGDKGSRYASRIVAAAERMEGLIADLLTYSRLQRAQVSLRALDPTGIVLTAAEEARAAAGAESAMVEVEAPLPQVLADPVVLAHVMGNLLTNAVKFRREGEPARVRVRGVRDGERVSLWVEDQGIGIAPEHRERIFGAFERLHGQETFPGTGIGLAIVKAGVERLDGTIAVEDNDGPGARFRLDLRAPAGNTGTPGGRGGIGEG